MVSRQRLTNAGMLTVALMLIATSVYIAVGSAQTAGMSNTTTQNNNKLTMSGTGVATITPDQAQVTLGAVTQAASVQDASSKAQTMMGALGVKILGVPSATESTPYNPPIYYTSTQADKGTQGTPIQPGTFSLTASVQLTYVI